MDIAAILNFYNQRLNGFAWKGFNSLAVLSSEVDTSAVGGVPVDQMVLIGRRQNFSQEGDLLVNGVCGIGLNGVHIILYSADGDALDGLVFEKYTLLPEPSALGYVGVGSQMPLIPRIEGFCVCRERVLFLRGWIHINGDRRRIIRKIIIDSAAANYLLQPSKEALFFAASADLPVEVGWPLLSLPTGSLTLLYAIEVSSFGVFRASSVQLSRFWKKDTAGAAKLSSEIPLFIG